MSTWFEPLQNSRRSLVNPFRPSKVNDSSRLTAHAGALRMDRLESSEGKLGDRYQAKNWVFWGIFEAAMKKSESRPYKQLLIQLRARLRGDVSALADAALNKTRSEASGDLSSMPIHPADVGSDNFEQE